MHHFYRNAALLGLSYLEARILHNTEMVKQIKSVTPEKELTISINQAILHITKTMSCYEEVDLDDPLDAIKKTRQTLIKQIISV